MTTFSPREIVSELDRYIIGQKDAKRAVAIVSFARGRMTDCIDSLLQLERSGSGLRTDPRPASPRGVARGEQADRHQTVGRHSL